MEDRMTNPIIPRLMLFATFIVFIPVIGSCGSNMEGTYTAPAGGPIALDLKSGGKANFSLMGEDHPCTYKMKSAKLMLDCTPKGEKIDFTIHDDGSLSGPGFIGVLKKSK
jgi:hypothetical protein